MGCGDDDPIQGTAIARVGDEVVYQEVVDALAEREGQGDDEARRRVVETLRWVAARRAELAERPEPPLHADDLDPARARQLERAALVRLWLREHFEPEHQPAAIPDGVVRQNLADPNVTRRLFHPEVWVVCQVLIVPAAKGEDGRPARPPSEGDAALRWRARAEQALEPFATRSRRLEADLLAARNCDLLARLADSSVREFPAIDPEPGATAGPEHAALRLRFEQFGFAPSESAGLDRGWVEAVTASPPGPPGPPGPRLVGPFASPFGVHLVLVADVRPASLEEGSLAPDELEAAREDALREAMHERWLAEQLQVELQRARDERVVRLAPDLER